MCEICKDVYCPYSRVILYPIFRKRYYIHLNGNKTGESSVKILAVGYYGNLR